MNKILAEISGILLITDPEGIGEIVAEQVEHKEAS